ncbi:MAG: thiamine-phosphate kinase [Thermoguttaceae bacterium]|nr:thiamine-phosphate kinase [Thermoguttaceae bacterium]
MSIESNFLSQIASFARKNPHDSVLLGIGDDAAVLKNFGGNPVVTVDMLMDGTDFILDELSPQLVGRKALAVNLSDIAAMAAKPVAAFVAVALPQQGVAFHKTLKRSIPSLELAQRILEGMRSLAKRFGVAIAGGDTNTWNSPLAISVTMIGVSTSRGVLRRDGVRYDATTGRGDAIWVTGQFGGSILSHHYAFMPRIEEALWLHEHMPVHAAMDVSDGLSLDLSRLATASGCGIIVDCDAIPIAPDAYQLAQKVGRTPLQHALSDGEDFELIMAMDPDWETSSDYRKLMTEHGISSNEPGTLSIYGTRFTRIGTACAEPGLWTRTPDGTLQPLKPEGWLH